MNKFLITRKALGLTQAKLAKELGTRQATVSRYENGKPLDARTELALEALLIRKELGVDTLTHDGMLIACLAAAAQSNRTPVLDGGATA